MIRCLVPLLLLGAVPALAQSADRRLTHQCRGTVFCAEMRSCEEAMFHLQRCGQTRLDRDRDGVPCEANACRSGRARR
jgi:hypothetical protein